MSTSVSYFFISYSREDANLQRRIIAELRGRGIHVWVDIENLIPGSHAWEDEDDSILLRLSSHQHMDMRKNFHHGLDELTNAPVFLPAGDILLLLPIQGCSSRMN